MYTYFDVTLCRPCARQQGSAQHRLCTLLSCLALSRCLSDAVSHADFQNRPPFEFKPIHIVSLPVMDTPQHAEQAMVDVLKLVKMLDACDDVESQGADVVEAFQATTKRPILHQVCHL
eukprot:TRINITY_DN4964_c0_g1_i3.p2 TRINITY_DN4964_c0_g1~~TRINITY_DN4964_c0_g1_i3.p2  ORF type:complete len:118 (-),score=10.41 TRINITY_DN4964_c0_g1_i3:130-483(-)